MKPINKAATGYSRRVKRHLVCGAQSREQIHNRALGLIRDFAEENPEALYADYVAAFGEPKDFAADALSVLDESEVRAEKHKRIWVRIGILICGFILLCVIIVYWYIQWQNAAEIVEGIPVFYVVEEQTDPVDLQEYQEQFAEGRK